jgi:uncharacterized SAM-binding protein YcdF (DUF218 family)
VKGRARRTAALAIIAAAAGYAGILSWVVSVSRHDQRHSADAIVVLGAAHYNGRPSPVLRARLDHALTLFRAGLAPRVVVTGGTRAGDTESEAKVERRFLIQKAVPESAVIALSVGRTTEETMSAVGSWMKEHGFRSALLVSDGFHLARLRLEARRLDLQAYTSPAAASPIQTGSRQEWIHFMSEALKVPITWLNGL